MQGPSRLGTGSDAVGWLHGDAFRRRMNDVLKFHSKNGPYPSLCKFLGTEDGNRLMVCGGGYSIRKTLSRIRKRRKMSKRTKIAAVNKTHDWLIKRGVIPDYALLVDPRPHVVNYMTPHPKVTYLLSANLDWSVYQKFRSAGVPYYLWIAVSEYEVDEQYINEHFPMNEGFEHACVTGAPTVGLRTIPCTSLLGFEEFELHGFDSCYTPRDLKAGELYAYDKPESDYEEIDITAVSRKTGKRFRCMTNKNMRNQMQQFPDILERAGTFDVVNRYGPLTIKEQKRQEIYVAGDGVIPWLAYQDGRHIDMDGMERKYGRFDEYDYRGTYYSGEMSDAA